VRLVAALNPAHAWCEAHGGKLAGTLVPIA
jgi:hypothetical protein